MAQPALVDIDHLIPACEEQVLANISMPLKATFYPLGFPATIITNSPKVIEAANLSWGKFQLQSEDLPMTLHLGVTSDPDRDFADRIPEPIFRVQGHLMSCIADAHNFVTCDLTAGSGFGWVRQQTIENSLYLRYHLLESAILCMISATKTIALHAACISSNGSGILLCGDSGAGKSSLAFACSRSGWTFTCDDASYLLLNQKDPTVVGNCYQFRLRDSGVQLFPELEGRSPTPRIAGKPSLEIPTEELSGVMTSQSSTVKAIVFVNRKDKTRHDLVSLSADSVRSWFHQFPFLEEGTNSQQREALNNLLEIPVYELRYTNLDWAIDRLNRLVHHGS